MKDLNLIVLNCVWATAVLLQYYCSWFTLYSACSLYCTVRACIYPWPMFALWVSSLFYSSNFSNSPWFPILAISVSESWYSWCPFNLIFIVCTGMPLKWRKKGLYILVDRSDRIEARGGQLIGFACNISQCQQLWVWVASESSYSYCWKHFIFCISNWLTIDDVLSILHDS